MVADDTLMRRCQVPLLARIRPVAAPWLLCLFVSGTQLAPAVHVAWHRPDHHHESEAGDHERRAAFDLDVDHDDDHDHEADHHDSADAAAFDRGRPRDHDRAHGDGHAGDHDAPAPAHGHGSAAHFLLALLDAPPPPFLPPPPETLAPAPDVTAPTCHPAPLPQPPARGPPVPA